MATRVLAINCGSASLKFARWAIAPAGAATSELHGAVAWSGGRAAELRLRDASGAAHEYSEPVADHVEAVSRVFEWLESIGGLDGVDAVGHRIVHGGPHFHQAVRIDADVLHTLDGTSELAPLHNPGTLRAVRRTRELLGEALPMVAVFDTAFHRRMPPRAELYPLNDDLTARLGLRRYGFHGIAHQYMAQTCAEMMRRPLPELRLITLQLGNGCSAAAIHGGHSIDTSMGFTPLEGLMMGTRCGDLDPGMIIYMMRHHIGGVDDLEKLLNGQCGLLGVSGRSRDMRELLEAEAAGDARAGLAIEMFCYRVRKYIGAYLAVLGGADAIVFGGGIGENAAEIRRRVCEGMAWAGLSLDSNVNPLTRGVDARISTDGSGLHAYTVAVREELLIARETAACLGR